ncbi:probable calcium-binding protein CML46 [Primulina huaijiensis]|uniref:probable calcium-binding protein CML46 n=1 Tax=Primulina huaijiensis TaxID=1492673 RepID=UPI003CC74A6A
MSKGCRDLSQIFYVTTESCFEQTIVAHIDAPTSVNFEDVEIIFEKLGLDSGARKVNKRNRMERQESNIEVGSVFDKVQPCLDEVREAFNIFDANNDGFIDANELEKVINSMGFMRFSREDYQRMIMAFDYNGDGKIDFEEFVKLMQDCSY